MDSGKPNENIIPKDLICSQIHKKLISADFNSKNQLTLKNKDE